MPLILFSKLAPRQKSDSEGAERINITAILRRNRRHPSVSSRIHRIDEEITVVMPLILFSKLAPGRKSDSECTERIEINSGFEDE